MKRLRYEYYFRAIICFVFGFAFITIVPILPVLMPALRETGGQVAIGGVGLGLLFLFIGFINYYIAKKDENSEKEKDKKIAQLEKDIQDLKTNKKDLD